MYLLLLERQPIISLLLTRRTQGLPAYRAQTDDDNAEDPQLNWWS